MDKYESDAALDRMFHALADPTRRAVVGRLLKGEASVSDLAPEPEALVRPLSKAGESLSQPAESSIVWVRALT